MEFRTDLLEAGRKGTFFFLFLYFVSGNRTDLGTGVNHHIAQDGRVAVLTVNRL